MQNYQEFIYLVHEPVEGSAQQHLRFLRTDRTHRMLWGRRSIRPFHHPTAHQGVGRLKTADVGPFLAQALGTVLAFAHPHPVASADHRRKCRLQRGPLAETAGGEQRHRARVTPHLKLQHLGKPEGRHRLGQQLLQQGVDDLLITQGGSWQRRHARIDREDLHQAQEGIDTRGD